jgi:iron complex transport system ATP-binding protein
VSALRGAGLVYEIRGRRLVDGIDVELHAGEVLGVVGPNGAGKSTLCRLLAGDLRPTRGVVELGGVSVRDLSARELARRRAVMPQSTTIGFGFTVEQIVEMGCHPLAGGPADVRRGVRAALARVGVEHLAPRRFRTLSGGEQALVTLARVLAQRAPVLLLDEPTAALDLHHQERAMQIARDVADEGGAVLVVAHDVNLAAAYADTLCVLDRGAVAACGEPWPTLAADVLERVFGRPMLVCESPGNGAPLVVPVRGSGLAATGDVDKLRRT